MTTLQSADETAHPDHQAADAATDPPPVAPLPARPGAVAPLAEKVTVGGGRGWPGARRIFPGPDRANDAGDSLH